MPLIILFSYSLFNDEIFNKFNFLITSTGYLAIAYLTIVLIIPLINFQNHITGSAGVVVVVVLNFSFWKSKLKLSPLFRNRDTKVAVPCSSRSKNCDIQYQPDTFSDKFPKKAKFLKILWFYQLVYSVVQTNLVVEIVELRVFAFVLAERVFHAVLAASGTVQSTRTSTLAFWEIN